MSRKFRVLMVVAATLAPAFHGFSAAQDSPRTLLNQALAEADGADPNTRNESGETLLHIAGWGDGDPAVIRALIAGGAEVNAKDRNGYTPLLDKGKVSLYPDGCKCPGHWSSAL